MPIWSENRGVGQGRSDRLQRIGLSIVLILLAALGTLVWLSRNVGPARRAGSSGSAMAAGAPAQVRAGSFLVARRDLPDPTFARSVVLLLRHDERASMGLVINRQAHLELAELFPDQKDSPRGADPVFWGGPVGATGVLALLRAQAEPEAEQVLPGVYLISTKTLLKKKLSQAGGPRRLRLYLGYCGWGPSQLLRELEMGAWHVMPGEEKLVFDAEPETLWQRLIARTELIQVRAPQPATPAADS